MYIILVLSYREYFSVLWKLFEWDLLGNRRRPADVFLPNFGNAGLCIDLTAVNDFMHAKKRTGHLLWQKP